VPNISHPDIWLELETNDTESAAAYLKNHGVARRDEVEQLREDFDGFWISDPAGIIHLVVGDEEVFPDVSLDNNAAGIPVSVTTVRDQMIRITAQIDGRSQLILRGNTAQWHHFDYTAPGLWFANAPTTVNGYDWYPSWPNGTGSGSTSSVLESVSPALPASPIPVALALIEGRGSVTVVQQPTADNSYTTVIDFNDNEFGGAVFYTVEVWFASVASP
jgi:hypothetical protein